ncbi:hypothetical protein JD844_019092 [Phrynosoma platyrhinos]|uniref:MRG domain binding protein n=1 Tax=Phrynosoma platyrhinos TaxID=52577 RepID=A0ABQ7SPL2_PHRPL|nr:hypothetical protein JD844_019092 [Phrynosoma platyrhinos]
MGDAESSAGSAAEVVAAVKAPGPAVAPEPPSSQAAASEESAASASVFSTAASAPTTTAATAAPPPPPPPPLPAPPVPVVWSPEVEVCLFHAMLGHKPVGVNRHFHMICIRDKFSQNIGRQISSKVIWDHLSTMYDMQALHESEILPFPNSEKNFILPEDIIQEVKEVYASLGSLAKAAEKPSGKEKERSSSESGSKEGADKRKRNRVTEKVLNANSNPSSPSAAKRRRT